MSDPNLPLLCPDWIIFYIWKITWYRERAYNVRRLHTLHIHCIGNQNKPRASRSLSPILSNNWSPVVKFVNIF